MSLPEGAPAQFPLSSVCFGSALEHLSTVLAASGPFVRKTHEKEKKKRENLAVRSY